METKKNPQVNLENFRRIFSLIGVVISLGIIMTFFSWRTDTGNREDLSAIYKDAEDEIAEITRPEDIKMPEPEIKKEEIKSEIIEEVTDKTKTTDVDFSTETGANDTVKIIEIEEPTIKEDNFTYVVVEKMPEYPGGINALRRDIAKKIEYPAIAKENDMQGTVYLRFVVEKNGKVGQIYLIRGVDKLLDDEAIRVVKLLKKFKPGEQGGKKVRVWFSIPVKYSLN